MKEYLSILMVCCLAFAVGCDSDDSESDGPSGPVTLCTPGEGVCFGSVAATCNSDANSYSTVKCADNQLCEVTNASSSCKTVECMPGQAICFDAKTANICSNAGTWVKTPCDASSCVAGGCRKVPCTPKEVVCGSNGFATCADDGLTWSETLCGANEVCNEGECVAQKCRPGDSRCLNEETSQACNETGSDWLAEKSCPGNEVCNEVLGVCLPIVTVAPTPQPDVITPTDTPNDTPDDGPPIPKDEGPKAELEPLDKAQCTVDGENIAFTSNLSATYLESEQDLRISMDKGQKKIEISIKPIESGDIGQWSSTVAEDVQVFIFYNDGSDIGGAQWKYQSVEYELTLNKFQSAGGRVQGEFSGKFTPDQGVTTVPFGDGNSCTFDVKRHD